MDLVEIGAGFDVFGRGAAILGDILRGGHRFYINAASCPVRGADIKRILQAEGVDCWGLTVDGEGDFTISVSDADARRAQVALQRYDVQVMNPEIPVRNTRRGRREQPTGKRTGSPFDIFG
jgi:hypothetical protein